MSESEDKLITATVTADHVAVLEPALSLLEPLLQYERRIFSPGGPLGYQVGVEQVSLCELDIKGRLCFPAGLLARVRRTLHEHGYRLRVKDQRTTGPRLTVDESALARAESDVKPLVRAIIYQPLGQIEAASDKDALARMCLIDEVYPDARVVVAVATRDEARRQWRQLQKALGGQVELVMAGSACQGRRWLVGTFGSVPRNMAGEYDILLLPHGEEAVGSRAIAMVVGMRFQRIYAFIRPQRRPDRLVHLRLEQMAGPVIHRIKRPRAAVRVLMLPSPACQVMSDLNALDRKRDLYWRNETRNTYVAQVAQAVYSGDRQTLKDVGLRNKDIKLLKDLDKDKVMILVESPEHGRQLLQMLPGWNMLDLVPDKVATSANETKLQTRTPAVVTSAYAARQGIRAEVVVRATGTGWPLRIKAFPPRVTRKGPSEVLVIDLDDSFHAEACEDTRRRTQEYEHKGMKVTTRKAKGI